MAEASERQGAVTFKGNPVTLVGPELKAGDQAPDFKVLANDLSEFSLANTQGKTRLISVVPSVDTPVCDEQTKKFNEEAAKLPENVAVLTISCDLPFAQKRWCGATGSGHVQLLSDYRDTSFGRAYGVLIKELRLLARAVFIVGPDDKIQYVEYVPEVTGHPNYDAALNALKSGIQA